MDDHLIAIKKDVESQNYYSALFLTIALPSICGALESVDGLDTKTKYIAWYDHYVKDLFLTGSDCYKLRCSLLHQASTVNSESSLVRVVFTFPVASGNTFHNNIINGALNLDVPLFCSELVRATDEWISKMEEENNANYIKNVPSVMRLYPKGAPPYFSGQPVIS